VLRSFSTYAAWFGKRSLLFCRNRIQGFFRRLGTSICNCLAPGRTTRQSGRIICHMMGKGKRLDASWTMAKKLLASVSYRIATRRKRYNLEKNREGLEWVAVRRLMKSKEPQMRALPLCNRNAVPAPKAPFGVYVVETNIRGLQPLDDLADQGRLARE
jgi:hypothetical protein